MRVAASLASAALPVLLVLACGGGVSPGPVEPSAPECPTSGERTCKQSSDCGDGLHCTGGSCFLNHAGCPCSSGVSDCGTTAHCTRGQCYENRAGNPCSATTECGPRAHCTVDTCYANASGSPCQEANDCGPGSSCVSGKCN